VIETRPNVLNAALPLVLMSLLGACAIGPDNWAVTSPGKFAFYSCDQLLKQGQTSMARIAELEEVMAKSARAPGGELVNAVAYQSEYAAAQADLREAEVTAANKKCRVTVQKVSDVVVR
jgi:hypothetical protein